MCHILLWQQLCPRQQEIAALRPANIIKDPTAPELYLQLPAQRAENSK